MSNMVSGNFDLGPDFSGGPEGVDRSLLALCLKMATREDFSVRAHGWAIEFGTGTGETAAMIADYLPVVTFDSFQGLPEDWRPGFPKGKFSDLPIPPDMPGVTIVPGWFSDTVANYDWPDHIALIHFDADLYSSTKTALDSIGGHIGPGCYLVFDEFFGYEGCQQHEYRAFAEFVSEIGLLWDVIGHGREQWAVRVR